MIEHRASSAESDSPAGSTRQMQAALGVKRSLDISMGVALGMVTLPAMLLIAAAIRLDSPGPALFRANRIGRHGKPFAMYKFRTMVKDAEERLHEFAHLNLGEGMTKIPDDPRVTRIGKVLRRFSLDELPQIVNIIAGHMSMVGPRPHDAHELSKADLEHDPRLSVRPGLTGLWQISARSNPNLASRHHYDLQYVSRWSLLLDAKILAKTVPVVVMGRGGFVDGAIAPAVVASFANGHRSNGKNNGAIPKHRMTSAASDIDVPRSGAQGLGQHSQDASYISSGMEIATVAIGESAT